MRTKRIGPRLLAALSGGVLLTSVAGNVGVGTVGAQSPPDQGSPVATSAPAVSPVVADYAEVGPAYDAARAEVLAEGREVAELLLAGDAAALSARLGPELAPLLPEERLRSLVPALESDRVHFELPQFGAVFDGHLDGRTIEGFFLQGTASTFRLEATRAPVPGRPLDGRWEGEIEAGELRLGFAVELATVDGALRGTLDIPEQGLKGIALANHDFAASVELGERLADTALPQSPGASFYQARYAWGEAQVAVSIGLTPEGVISILQVAPEWPLAPDPAAEMETETTFRLPFEGVWWVYWGGGTVLENYHAAVPAQRHAYDLTIWKNGAAHRGDGLRNEDYWVWHQPVSAPAGGTVVAVLDGIVDNTPWQTNLEAHPAGNHVVIQTADDEFVFVAHLSQGSVRVAEGDRVEAGDLMGLAGNSGNSTAPHLHVHVQTRADLFAPDAVGLPLRFTDYVADGEPVALGVPVQGQFIQRG